MTVRAATAADVDAVVALERSALGADAWSPALLAPAVGGELPTVLVLVSEAGGPGGPVVGHAVASLVPDTAELQRIAVDPGHRRAGLASGLLDAVLRAAGEAGAEHLLLEVREDNAGALAFYARHGFTELDRRPRYYRDGASAVVMRRPVSRR